MEAEGWYVDPYRRRRARWFSSGTPTDLLSDGGAESSDPPPEAPYTGSLEPIDQGTAPGGDFAHWDKDDRTGRDDEGVEAVWDVFVESGGD
jgi:hypothetical protein